jgi:hypothetical protein
MTSPAWANRTRPHTSTASSQASNRTDSQHGPASSHRAIGCLLPSLCPSNCDHRVTWNSVCLNFLANLARLHAALVALGHCKTKGAAGELARTVHITYASGPRWRLQCGAITGFLKSRSGKLHVVARHPIPSLSHLSDEISSADNDQPLVACHMSSWRITSPPVGIWRISTVTSSGRTSTGRIRSLAR